MHFTQFSGQDRSGSGVYLISTGYEARIHPGWTPVYHRTSHTHTRIHNIISVILTDVLY